MDTNNYKNKSISAYKPITHCQCIYSSRLPAASIVNPAATMARLGCGAITTTLWWAAAIILILLHVHIVNTQQVDIAIEEGIESGLIRRDFQLEGLTFGTLDVFGFMQCLKECLLRTKCLSLNYHRSALACELNEGTVQYSPAENAEFSPGAIYTEKTDWSQVGFNLVPK
jgi:hypothetical protein